MIVFFGVGSMASIYSNPFLDGVVIFGDDAEALLHLPVLLLYLLLHECDLGRQVRDTICPFIKDGSCILMLGIRHDAVPVVEVDREIVSRHDVNGDLPGAPDNSNAGISHESRMLTSKDLFAPSGLSISRWSPLPLPFFFGVFESGGAGVKFGRQGQMTTRTIS